MPPLRFFKSPSKSFQIKISHDKEADVYIFRIKGDLDAPHSRKLQSQFDTVLERGGRRFIFDLAEVAFLRSVGMGALIHVRDCLQEKDGMMRLTGINSDIQDLLELLNMTGFMPIFASIPLARQTQWIPPENSILPDLKKSRSGAKSVGTPPDSTLDGSEIRYKLVFDRAACVGAGICVEEHPEQWTLDSEHKAKFTTETFGPADLASSLAAAEGCPAQVIQIIESDSGDSVYPPAHISTPVASPAGDAPEKKNAEKTIAQQEVPDEEIDPILTPGKPAPAVGTPAEIPEAPTGFQNYRILRNMPLTPTVHQIVLAPARDGVRTPAFQAGQYLGVYIDDAQGAPLRRSYSLAGAPELDELQLCVKRVEGGRGSNHLHSLKAGQYLPCREPLGRFVLREEETSRNIYFVGTGTGIAPLRSMLRRLLFAEELRELRSGLESVHLILGVRDESEILFEDEWRVYEKAAPAFSFKICLSRPWKEKTRAHHVKGRVTAELEARTYPDDALFYFCGGGDMIADSRKILGAKGVSEDKILFEKFF